MLWSDAMSKMREEYDAKVAKLEKLYTEMQEEYGYIFAENIEKDARIAELEAQLDKLGLPYGVCLHCGGRLVQGSCIKCD